MDAAQGCRLQPRSPKRPPPPNTVDPCRLPASHMICSRVLCRVRCFPKVFRLNEHPINATALLSQHIDGVARGRAGSAGTKSGSSAIIAKQAAEHEANVTLTADFPNLVGSYSVYYTPKHATLIGTQRGVRGALAERRSINFGFPVEWTSSKHADRCLKLYGGESVSRRAVHRATLMHPLQRIPPREAAARRRQSSPWPAAACRGC
jgi:hypothetical protein